MLVVDVLRVGRENAMDSETLMRVCGYASKRALSKEIERERKAGYLVLSSSRGYFRPSSREEIQSFVRNMEGRAKSIFFVLRTARAALDQPEGQLLMEQAGSE